MSICDKMGISKGGETVHKVIIFTLVFILVDIIVGIIKAFYTNGYKSLKMREGLFHKVGEIIIIAFGVLCEQAFPVAGINIDLPIVATLCVYIIIMETGSILENLVVISPTLDCLIGKVFGGVTDGTDKD